MELAWLSLVIVTSYLLSLGFCAQASNYNGCHNDSWVYYSHTHSCILPGTLNLNWGQARKECQNYNGSIGGDIKGHLMKINDKETDQFVKELLPDQNTAHWIGMYYNFSEKGYRWYGFPYQKPIYFGFEDGSSYRVTNKAFVIKKGKWLSKTATEKFPFFCEHDAKINRSSISCPSTPVNVDEGIPSSSPVKFVFYFNQWQSVQVLTSGSTDPIEVCSGSSTNCQTNIGNTATTATSPNGRTTVSVSGPITTRQNGTWTFSVLQARNALDTKSCDLHAYKPPSSTKCITKFQPDTLNVSCTTQIFPEAACQFSYQTENNLVTDVTSLSYRHTLHDKSQTEGATYESQCSFSLSSQDLDWKVGKIKVQVTLHPDMDGVKQTTTPKAFHKHEEILVVALPVSQLIINDTQTITSDATVALTLSGGDPLTLECQLRGGNPDVQKTTLSCQFPIDQSGATFETTEGTTVRVTMESNRTMYGKRCTCWGNHITGKTDILTVTWNIPLPEDEDGNIALIIGLVITFSLLLIIVIIVIVFLVWRRRRRHKQGRSDQSPFSSLRAIFSRKASSPSVPTEVECKEEKGCGSENYAQVVKRKGPRDNPGFCLDESPYSNESHVLRRPANEELQDKREEHTYSNVGPPLPAQGLEIDAGRIKPDDESKSKADDKHDGLIYADITINGVRAGQAPRKAPAKDGQIPNSEPATREPPGETTEYMALSVTATLQLKEKSSRPEEPSQEMDPYGD